MADSYVCKKCGKVAKTKQALERHAAYHEDERPFACEVCLQRFKNSDDRGKHYRRLRRDSKFNIACTVCHKHFKSHEILHKHLEILGCLSKANNEDPGGSDVKIEALNDEATGSETIVEEVLKDAKSTESCVPDQKLVKCVCKICPAGFLDVDSLKTHYKIVHNETKRQVCLQCGQTLSSKDSLARHFSIFHQQDYPYQCSLCDQKFKIKEGLCRHIKFVHKDKGYECDICHRIFSQPVNLKKHMAVHTAEKEFLCTFCGREFRWKQALQKHMLLHQNGAKMVGKVDNMGINLCPKHDDLVKPEEGFVNDKSEIHVLIHDDDEDDNNNDDDDDDDDDGDDDDDDAQSDSFDLPEILSVSGAIKNGGIDLELNKHSRNVNEPVEFNSSPVPSDVTKSKQICSDEINDSYNYIIVNDAIACEEDTNEETILKETNQDTSSLNIDTTNLRRKRKSSEQALHLEPGKFSKVYEFASIVSNYTSKQDELDNFDSKQKTHVHSLNIGQDKVIKHSNSNDCIEIDDDSDGDDAYSEESQRQSSMSKHLTSVPAEMDKDAPPWYFKPAFIHKIMSKPKLYSDEDSNDFTYSNTKTALVSPEISERIRQEQLLAKKFQVKVMSPTSQAIISGRTTSAVEANNQSTANKPNGKKMTNTGMLKSEERGLGKFSLVKHMLSLQNEDNFDKAIFRNPLYSAPADINGFKKLVERHKISAGADDDLYDLSAKQNIPFMWLGMKKTSMTTDNKRKHENQHAERKGSTDEALHSCDLSSKNVDSVKRGNDEDVCRNRSTAEVFYPTEEINQMVDDNVQHERDSSNRHKHLFQRDFSWDKTQSSLNHTTSLQPYDYSKTHESTNPQESGHLIDTSQTHTQAKEMRATQTRPHVMSNEVSATQTSPHVYSNAVSANQIRPHVSYTGSTCRTAMFNRHDCHTKFSFTPGDASMLNNPFVLSTSVQDFSLKSQNQCSDIYPEKPSVHKPCCDLGSRSPRTQASVLYSSPGNNTTHETPAHTTELSNQTQFQTQVQGSKLPSSFHADSHLVKRQNSYASSSEQQPQLLNRQHSLTFRHSGDNTYTAIKTKELGISDLDEERSVKYDTANAHLFADSNTVRYTNRDIAVESNGKSGALKNDKPRANVVNLQHIRT